LDAPTAAPYRSLFMRRPHLRDLPPVELPVGYQLRTAVLEEEAELGRLLSAAFDETWDLDAVRRRLLEDDSVVAVYVIERPDGRLVASASSRLVPDRYPGSGYLHWVGADPVESGKGLGRQITLAVLHDFARRGLVDSVLETDDWRLPALATYLKCGYLPELRAPEDADRWAAVRAALRPGTLP
jgi:mycothiol synthase